MRINDKNNGQLAYLAHKYLRGYTQKSIAAEFGHKSSYAVGRGLGEFAFRFMDPNNTINGNIYAWFSVATTGRKKLLADALGNWAHGRVASDG